MRVRLPGDTDYVLIVHGTWNAPLDSEPRWYQLRTDAPDNFCAQLSARLDERGMPGSVWRAGPQGPINFHWSGNNDHQARLDAAEELFGLMVRIIEDDPSARIHLVAHSHGGNVVLGAIQRYLEHLEVSVDAFLQEYPGWYANHPNTSRALGEAIEWLKSHEQGGEHPPSDIVSRLFTNARKLLEDIRAQGREPDATLFAKRKMLLGEWFDSPTTNRLGRIVCMGTPFLTKRWWRQPAHGVATAFRRMAATAFWAVPVIYALGLLFMVASATSGSSVIRLDAPGVLQIAIILGLLTGVFALLGGPPSRKESETRLAWFGDLFLWIGTILGAVIVVPIFAYLWAFLAQQAWTHGPEHLNPVWWPGWLLILASMTLVVILISALPVWAMRDANLYFDDYRVGRYMPTARIPVLTIAAPHLDEAQIALSAEPLLRSQFLPRLHEILYPSIHWRPRYAVVGVRGASPSVVGSRAIAALRQWIGNLFWIVARTAGRPVLSWIERLVASVVRQTLMSAATGVPARELQTAEAQVSAKVGLEHVFAETPWDVTPLLAGRSVFHGAAGDATDSAELSQRYAYLWDESALRHSETTSQLWRQVRATLDTYVPADFRHDLLVRSITVERRIEEVVGLVELTHSSYYGDSVVIERIAEFLATGQISSLKPDRSSPVP